MGLFNLRRSEPVQVVEVGGYQSFSTPFLKVPTTNLSLPYVDDRFQARGYVPFGEDNLYPQYLNQMYYTSPLHSAIVNYKVNAVCGGGYELLVDALTAKDKVDSYAAEKRIGIRKNIKPVLMDLIVHGRVYFIIQLKNGKAIKYKRIGAEKVRVSKCKTMYLVNDNWQYVTKIDKYEPYHPECKDGVYIYTYENESLGQDIYSLPSYTSALNWVFLDGEMSYLHKSNIQNSVFPSFAMMFPKKPQGREEMELIKETVNKLKGAENAGKAVAFFANTPEQLPKIEAIPTNSNADLFKESSDLNTEQICFSHTIDPILLGVRTTGSLGNGSDIKQAYVIFEKNVIIPLREMVTEIVDQLVKIAGIKTNVTITNYQIINETISAVDDEGDSTMEALNSMSPLVATKVLEMMTINEVRSLAGLPAVEGGDVTNTQAQAEANKNIGI
jgi:hypothetical protein